MQAVYADLVIAALSIMFGTILLSYESIPFTNPIPKSRLHLGEMTFEASFVELGELSAIVS
jgi:hypothetical protein